MSFVNRTEKMECLIKLITNENTGPSEQLCESIYVSRPTLMRYLTDLRDLGNQIGYCRYRRSYYFIKKRKLHVY